MIEATLRYTPKLYRDYTWFYLFRGKNYRLRIAMFSVFTVMMLILLPYAVWAGNGFMILILSLALIVCIGMYAVALTSPSRFKKLSPAMFQSEMHLVFEADRYVVKQSHDDASGTTVAKYEVLYMVYETKNTFYIFISQSQAYVVPKDKITKGSPEGLRGLFQSRLENKFVLCK